MCPVEWATTDGRRAEQAQNSVESCWVCSWDRAYGANGPNYGRNVHAFISYAHEDRAAAESIHRELSKAGIPLWLDVLDLGPGNNWRLGIADAIEQSFAFVALISSNSVTKTGYVQKELALALEQLALRPPRATYIIPVRLDEARPEHPQLRDVQWVDYFENADLALTRVAGALREQVPPPASSERTVGATTADARGNVISAQVLICFSYSTEFADGRAVVEAFAGVGRVELLFGLYDASVHFRGPYSALMPLIQALSNHPDIEVAMTLVAAST